MPRRYLALWLPFLPTDRLKRPISRQPDAGSPEQPVVLVGREHNALKLVDCDPRAIALGLTRGLTLADARARIPALLALPAQPEADCAFLDRLAAYCDRFTPLVALDPPHGLMLDITGCAHLFGGEAALMALIGRRMAAAGLGHRAAIAGTPEAAHALSRFGRGGVTAPGEDEAAIRPLPIAALVLPAEAVIALSRAGLKTVSDLAERPSATLSARFGEALVARLRRTLGHEDVRITPLRPLPDCVVERHFAEPLLDTAGLTEVVARLIAEAARVLARRGAGGRVFDVALFRSDGAVRRLALETSRPCRDAGIILRLWRERVETLADPLDPGFGFDAVKLVIPVCEPMAETQGHLDRRMVEDDEVAALVDRLVTRFGRDRVLRFAARDSHDPRRQGRMVAAGATSHPVTAWPAPQHGEPPARPLHLFDPPQTVETMSEVPDGPPMRFRWRRVLHEVARAEGPERIAPEWWRDGSSEPMRDYYRVEDAQGRRFWLFRAGLHEDSAPQPRWFLHGLFA